MRSSSRALCYGVAFICALCIIGLNYPYFNLQGGITSRDIKDTKNKPQTCTPSSDAESKKDILTANLQNITNGKLDCQTWDVKKCTRKANVLATHTMKTHSASLVREESESRKKSFTDIFNKKLWKGQKLVSNGSDAIIGSGPGSTLANTVNVRKTLAVVLTQVKAWLGKSKIRMLDIPCGDLTWMSEFMKDRNDVEYYGMDIVPDIIEHHKRVYTPKYPHMTFINQDIVAEPLKTEFDLIHTRQMTQHLTSADTITVLNHFVASGSHFLMATTVPSAREVELGHFDRGRHRLQNLEIKPYSLPPPICKHQDAKVEYNAVWLLNY